MLLDGQEVENSLDEDEIYILHCGGTLQTIKVKCEQNWIQTHKI